MANPEMAMLTEKRLKEMEAEMSRFEQEILVPKEFDPSKSRMIIGSGTFNKVKAKISGPDNDEPPQKMLRADRPSPGIHPGPPKPPPGGPPGQPPCQESNIPLSVLAAPPPPPPSLLSKPSGPPSNVPNLAPPPPPPPAIRQNLSFVPPQIRQRLPPPPPPRAAPPSHGPPGHGPPRPPPPYMGQGPPGAPAPYPGGHYQGHPQQMPPRGPPMRPPFIGPGQPTDGMHIGPTPAFGPSLPAEEKAKEPVIEKPKIVYSSAPVINKPDKKKKKKKEKADEESTETKTLEIMGDKSVGAATPAATPVPHPESNMEYTHVMEPEVTPDAVTKKTKKEKKAKKMVRTAAGETWEDPSLEEWELDDFRIFCGDLGNEVTDEVLARAFSKYPSFMKSKVVRDKRTNKTKGYGFVSFKDPNDFVQAMREMNGKYVGNRPIKLRKSQWKDRNIEIVRKKDKEKKRLGLR